LLSKGSANLRPGGNDPKNYGMADKFGAGPVENYEDRSRAP